MPSPEEALSQRELAQETGQAQLENLKQQTANLPTGEQAQAGHELGMQQKQADLTYTGAQTSLTKAQTEGFGLERQVQTEERLTKVESDLRNEWLKNPQTQRMQVVNEAYQKIDKVSQGQASPAGDLSLIFGYMKLLDPGSTVREGEQATAANAGAIPDRIVNAYNMLLGGQKLTPQQRTDFAARAQDLYSVHTANQTQFDNEFKRVASEKGADPNRVVLDLKFGSKGQGSTKEGAGKNIWSDDDAKRLMQKRPEIKSIVEARRILNDAYIFELDQGGQK